MAELLIVLMMAFNLWMVIYLTWERREENVPKEDKEKDVGAPERSGDIMGKSLFRMPERKPQAAAPMSNATVQAPGEEVDEKDVAFDDETASPNSRLSGARPSRQVPDEELDEVFADKRVSDIGAEYDEDGDDDGEPHEAGGMTFEDIDLAMRTVKKPKATPSRRNGVLRHEGQRTVRDDRKEFGSDPQETGRADGLLSGLRVGGAGKHYTGDYAQESARSSGQLRGLQHPRLCITSKNVTAMRKKKIDYG